jgi:hypothetical protein
VREVLNETVAIDLAALDDPHTNVSGFRLVIR